MDKQKIIEIMDKLNDELTEMIIRKGKLNHFQMFANPDDVSPTQAKLLGIQEQAMETYIVTLEARIEDLKESLKEQKHD